MLVARRFVVGGRVQGVGFRAFVQDAARREGLGGWVVNRPDGKVELLAEGEQTAVDRLERHIRRGPGRIQQVDVFDDVPSGRITEFAIRLSSDGTGV